MPVPTLSQLENTYFATATSSAPIHSANTEIMFIIDGIDYLREIHSAIMAANGAGDSIVVLGLLMEQNLDLLGNKPGQPMFQEVTDLLAEKAFDGVNVRVILSANPGLSATDRPKVGPFRDNIITARALRAWLPKQRQTTSPPLASRVLLDWSGALSGANHQKAFIIKAGSSVTAFVGGIDIAGDRLDQFPHDRLQIGANRWGWHDGGIRIRGAAATRVWENARIRWFEAAALPTRYYWLPPLTIEKFNPSPVEPDLGVAPSIPPLSASGQSVQVLRSFGSWKIDSLFPWQRVKWTQLPANGVKEIFETLTKAIGAAKRYIYVEDQYFQEFPPIFENFELFSHIRAAASRGVKVIFVGSGVRDPADKGLGPINASLNIDLMLRIVSQLSPSAKKNFVMYRLEHLTVHTKLFLIDDEFAAVGSANFFSRSMIGIDSELTVAVVDTGTMVRDLRIKLWAEHLRVQLGNPNLNAALENLDLALGIWRVEWLPAGSSSQTWRTQNFPTGFLPTESVLTLVGPA